MADSINVVEERFTFFWNIKNLHYSTLQNGENIDSPVFTVPSFQDTAWYLKLYPCGITKKNENCISCFICRNDDDGPERILIKYDIRNNLGDCFEGEHNFPKSSSWGYEQFILSDTEVVRKDGLPIEIIFRMIYMPKCISVVKDLVWPKNPNVSYSSTSVEEFKSQIDLKAYQVKREMFAFPTRCFAQTQFCTSTKLLQWPVPISMCNDDSFKHIIPLVFSDKSPSLTIAISNSKEDDDLDIRLQIEEDTSQPTRYHKSLIVCKITVLFDGSEHINLPTSITREFLYGDGTWQFIDCMNMSTIKAELDLNSVKNLSLNFEFTFPTGEIRSELSWEESINWSNLPSIYDRPLASNEMVHLYNERKLSDVIIKVKEEVFHVHKVVSAAVSPVFSAMLTSDMTENKTNHINIVDIEENTISQMILFIYTGSLKDLDFKNAKELFAAADKYQIVSLRNQCRNFLIESITYENVCEILSFADLYNDVLLKKAAIKIIYFHRSSILESSTWEDFFKENAILACEILTKICLMCK